MNKLVYIFAACFTLCSINAASQKSSIKRSSITSIVNEESDDEPEIDLTPAITQAYTLMNEVDTVIASKRRNSRSNSMSALTRSFDNLSETLLYVGVMTHSGSTGESLALLSTSISDLEKALSELSDS